jgi:hypothetical protein
MRHTDRFYFVLVLIALLSGCQVKMTKVPGQAIVPMSIVNTTDNTFLVNGAWQSTMGPLSNQHGGLACDNTVSDMRFHGGDYRYWHIAPSDSLTALGMRRCAPSANGEPSCSENWSYCGRKIRVKCLDPEFCGQRGEPSLLSRINRNKPPENNYIPDILIDELTQKVGRHPKAVSSVVLYITDFCPAAHSENRQQHQCQGPQVDISTSAFLMMGKTNEQGYIDSNVQVSIELLDENDPTPVGPKYR